VANVLIVDGQEPLFTDFNEQLVIQGHQVGTANTMHVGLDEAARKYYDLVILKNRLPDGRGLEFLPRFLETPSCPEVVMVADQADPDEAEQAIRGGAWRYLDRVDSVDVFWPLIQQVMEYRTNQKIALNGVRNLSELKFEGVLGRSAAIKECLDDLIQSTRSDAPVLLTGGTGTGKEVFAKAVHDNSRRFDRNFVVLDCAALPETLVESTLFGHTKGAYTGADSHQDGLIKQADGGTLLLDEVGELPLSVQTSFLRVLETQRFRPVGGRNEIHSDFRLVAATNQDLDQAVAEGRFRRDLLFRLRTFHIHLPPLKERQEDIEELTRHSLDELYQCYGLEPKELSSNFIEALKSYDWPGNIRELVNALERALVIAQDEQVLFSKHLPTNIRIKLAREAADGNGSKPQAVRQATNGWNMPTLQQARDAALAAAEKSYLTELMAKTKGDIKNACQVADISRSRLYALIRKHGVSRRSQAN
jgi:two-component system NtrC family response regulator